MSNVDIIRAWKDEEYRNSLSEAERAQLPGNPAGAIELSDLDLTSVAGGTTGWQCVRFTAGRLIGSYGTFRPARRTNYVGCGTYCCTC